MQDETCIYLIDMSSSMAHNIQSVSWSEEEADKAAGVNYNDDTKLRRKMSKRAAVAYALRAMMTARQAYATADKLGFVTFAGDDGRNCTKVLVPPSPTSIDHLEAIKQMSAYGNTPMFQGLKRAAEELKDAEGLVRILLISDGEPNASYTKNDIIDLAEEMHKELGFVIDCLGIGVPGETGDYDEKFLETVAAVGGGEFYPVENVDDLIKRLVEQVRERQLYIGGGIKMLGAASN
jgi:Mg-chelatase subunit ChlD